MAVTVTSTTGKTPATGSSFTYTSFAITGSNPAVVIMVALSSDTATVSSVACSAGLTCADGGAGANNGFELGNLRSSSGDTPVTYVSAWVLVNPSGTGTITVTLSASSAWQSAAFLCAGAHASTPCPTGAGNVGTATGISPNPLTITLGNLTTGEIGIGIGAQSTTGDDPAVGPTETFSDNTTNVNFSVGYRSDAGAVTCTWSSASSNDSLLVVRVVAAAAGGSSIVPIVDAQYRMRRN